MLARMLLQGHNQQLQQALRLDEEIAGDLKATQARLKAPRATAGMPGPTSPLLSGGNSLLIISDDDDLVSVNELFARADPAPTAATATATPAAGTHKRQISEAVPGMSA